MGKQKDFDKDINVRSKNDTDIDVGMTDEEIIIAEVTEAYNNNRDAGCYVGDLLRIIHRLQNEKSGIEERGEIVINSLHLTIDKQKNEIEQLTEKYQNAHREGYEHGKLENQYEIAELAIENTELKKQVDELKEQKAFWEGMHDRVCLKLEEYNDESEEYENALITKQYRITELQKQVDELQQLNGRIPIDKNGNLILYAVESTDRVLTKVEYRDYVYQQAEQKAVKEFATELLETKMKIVNEYYVFADNIKVIAKQKGIEVE
jgi:chromosome segregation ATPase